MAEVYENSPSRDRNSASLYERTEDGEEGERTRAPRQSVERESGENEDGEIAMGGSSPATVTTNDGDPALSNGVAVYPAGPPATDTAEQPPENEIQNHETNGNASHTPPPAEAGEEGLQSPVLDFSGEEGELET